MANDEKKDDSMLISTSALGEMLKGLVEEMKKPTVLEQKKIDEENAKRIELAERSVRAAKQASAARLAQQSACGHTDPKGKHSFRGALQSDGFVRPFCQLCHKEYPPFKANPEMFVGGVNLHDYSGLTEKHLYGWHKSTAEGVR